MAFLDLQRDLPRAAMMLPVSTVADQVVQIPTLERHVIQLSLHDSKRSVSSRGRGSVFLAWAFGLEKPNALADPRLEALRRYAVMFRIAGTMIAQDEDERLVRAGFSTSARDEIRQLVRVAQGVDS